MAIRLPGANPEITRKYRPGKRHHDEVAHVEVVSTADDAPRAARIIVPTYVDPAVANRLAVGVLLDLVGRNPADDQRTPDIRAGPIHGFDLQARPDQRRSQGPGIQVGR